MTGTNVLIPAASSHEFLTVCCHCHRVREVGGEWEVRYVPESDPVSHGICRACFAEYYPTVRLPASVR